MASLAELLVKVGADVSEFTKRMKEVDNKISETGKGLVKTGDTITGVGKKLGMSVTAPLVALGTTAVVTGMKFDAQMSKVQAVSGATGKEFDKLREMAKELGSTTVWSASESAQGMEFLARAGWKVDEIISAMPSVLNLATASAIDLGTASDIASNIISGFGASAEEAERYIDVLAKTTASSNTDMNQLGDAMKYVAPVANALGLSVEETASAIGILSDAGIQGSQAGTTLRTGLLNLASPSVKAKKVIDKLGMSFFELDGTMKSLPDILKEVEKGTADLTEEQRIQALETMFGKEAVSGFLALLDAGSGKLEDFTGELENSSGTAQEMADIMGDNLQGAFKGLLSALEGLAISFSDVMTPAIRRITEWVTEMVRKFDETDPAFKGIIVVVGLLVASIAPLLIVIGTTIKMFGLMMVAIGAISVPVVAVIGVIALLAFMFKDKIIDLFAGAMDWVKPIMNAFKFLTGGFDESIADAEKYGATIEDVIGSKAMRVVGIFQNIKTRAEEIWTNIKNVIVPMVETIKSIVESVLNDIKNFWDKNGKDILDKVTNAWEGILNIIQPILQDAMSFIQEKLQVIKDFWEQNGEQILNAVHNVFNGIMAVVNFVMPFIEFLITTVWNAIKGVINGALNIIMGLVKTFSGLFTGDFAGMWEGIKQLFMGAIEFVWNLMSLSFVGAIRKLVVNFAKNIVKVVKGKWTDIKTAFTNGKDNAVNLITQLKDKVLSQFGKMRDKVSEIFNKVKEFITNPIQTAKDTVLKIIDDIKNAFSNMKIELPKFKLPKVSISKEAGAFGIPYPKFDVQWNAKGAIFNQATLLGGGQGVGEAGAEAVIPIQHKRYMAPFASAIAEQLPKNDGQKEVVVYNEHTTIIELDGEVVGRKVEKYVSREQLNRQKRTNKGGRR